MTRVLFVALSMALLLGLACPAAHAVVVVYPNFYAVDNPDEAGINNLITFKNYSFSGVFNLQYSTDGSSFSNVGDQIGTPVQISFPVASEGGSQQIFLRLTDGSNTYSNGTINFGGIDQFIPRYTDLSVLWSGIPGFDISISSANNRNWVSNVSNVPFTDTAILMSGGVLGLLILGWRRRRERLS